MRQPTKASPTNQSLSKLRVLSFGLCMMSSTVFAMTAANTLIKNQASATFKDESGRQFSVTSNVVETLIQQVAALELTDDQQKYGVPGQRVEFPMVVTNVGNAPDTYGMSAIQSTDDDADFTEINFYADADGDGQPDDYDSPITLTRSIEPGEKFNLVAVGVMDVGVANHAATAMDVSVTSQFDNSITHSAKNTATSTSQAVVSVTKSINVSAATQNSGPYTVTLSYRNTSDTAATDVTIMDALPAGMSYVANSATWNEVLGVTLTDNDPTDGHVGQNNFQLFYCAYDPSCNGLTESSIHPDGDSSNQVFFRIDQVPARRTGTVTFQVQIDDGLAAGKFENVSDYTYHNGTETVGPVLTNPVSVTLLPSAALVANANHADISDTSNAVVAAVPAGENAVFVNTLWNTGNTDDVIDITLINSTFPAGTTIQLFNADGHTPLLDTNGDGTPDTGNIPAGQSQDIVIKAALPGNSADGTYQVEMVGTSSRDDSIFATVINQLNSIAAAAVDITNTSGAAGNGMGPEPTALKTVSVTGGQTALFPLTIINIGATNDTYDLLFGADAALISALPIGWNVAFYDASGNVVTRTSSIAPNQSYKVIAHVSTPNGEPSSVQSVYFGVESQVSAITDVIHNEVSIQAVKHLDISDGGKGTVIPGGAETYPVVLTNHGTEALTDVVLSTSDSHSAWSTQLYLDSNGNGVFDPQEQLPVNSVDLTPGESITVFQVSLAPTNAMPGEKNISTLTASLPNGEVLNRSVSTTTMAGHVDATIHKKQALDANCDGVPDSQFAAADFGAAPGQCVLYQLTAVNEGVATIHNVKIWDKSPAYTMFNNAGGNPSLSQGSLSTAIVDGEDGDISALVGALKPGQSATLIFGVKIQ